MAVIFKMGESWTLQSCVAVFCYRKICGGWYLSHTASYEKSAVYTEARYAWGNMCLERSSIKKEVRKSLLGGGCWVSDHRRAARRALDQASKGRCIFFPTQWIFASPLSLDKCCLSHLFYVSPAVSSLNLIFAVTILQYLLALSEPDTSCLTLELGRLGFP